MTSGAARAVSGAQLRTKTPWSFVFAIATSPYSWRIPWCWLAWSRGTAITGGRSVHDEPALAGLAPGEQELNVGSRNDIGIPFAGARRLEARGSHAAADGRQLLLRGVLPHLPMLPDCLTEIAPGAVTRLGEDRRSRREVAELPGAATL